LGLYVSFSRGALFACAAGLVAVVIAAGRREQLAATLLCLLAAVLAAVAAGPFGGVTSLQGTISTREGQGAIVLILLIVVALAAAVGQWLLIRRQQPGTLALPRRAPLWATAAIGAGLAIAILLGSKESSTASQPLSGGATRLVTLQSNRYAYWRVALRAFAQQPLRGVGAGGWSVYWLKWRLVNEFAQDAHSLPLQVLAELGVVGLALLAAFLAGLALAAPRALRASSYAVGPVAGFVAYIAHSPLDWDWQMPAVTVIAMVLGGALLAISQTVAGPRSDVVRTPETVAAQ
jgi:O-antigen ligase